MNKDQVGGKVDQAVGKVKQVTGEAVGNDNLANKGVAQQVKGAVKETWGNTKDAATEAGKAVKSEHANDGTTTREKISESVHNAKESVNAKIDDFKQNQRDKRSA
jgi:uncharacterized protein YjbJ (UPF0337 family)